MKVKLDENLPNGAVALLRRYGHEAATVPEEGLGGKPDPVVWDAAQREDRLVITLDVAFASVREHPPGTHAGVLVLRTSRQGRKRVLRLIETLLEQHDLGALRGCVAVADEQAVRVRRP